MGRMNLLNSNATQHFLRIQLRTKTKEGFKPGGIIRKKVPPNHIFFFKSQEAAFQQA